MVACLGTVFYCQPFSPRNLARLFHRGFPRLAVSSRLSNTVGFSTKSYLMKKWKLKCGIDLVEWLALYWKKDGDVFALPRVVCLKDQGKETLYWLKPETNLTLKGTPPTADPVLEQRVLAITPQLLAVLKAQQLATKEVDSGLSAEAASHLAEESEFVWLREPKEFPYLRQSFMVTPRRNADLTKRFYRNGELVGFTTLSLAAKRFRQGYYRRYFWFKATGADPFDGDNEPAEAVRVSSIVLGLPATPGRDS
jgi:Family of unknown function (DUF6009)